ncbi:SIS domain-containing protein [Arthrobacter sp. EH-1B-1]|uniref:SIS domain-containing protein n=1 Tax=Arthrobacter vasquezii TaxID=2977629 RepID=A0ABT6CTS4_9MICC|nr:SIS domain-containing protein [Arthrobacter vasquezii]MDF9277433.1 SIS domain-containing protein [Arthrobacter vasquezii]
MTTTPARDIATAAIAEVGSMLDEVPEGRYDSFLDEIVTAKTIVLHGVGREGLMIKALAMRLMHLGFDAHVLGDMTAPPVRSGDLLIVSAGPGHFGTIQALQEIAKHAGARNLLVTANPDGASAALADVVITLPGPTMSEDLQVPVSALLMGSVFEVIQLFFYDVAIKRLSDRLEQPLEDARLRHTNLE